MTRIWLECLPSSPPSADFVMPDYGKATPLYRCILLHRHYDPRGPYSPPSQFPAERRALSFKTFPVPLIFSRCDLPARPFILDDSFLSRLFFCIKFSLRVLIAPTLVARPDFPKTKKWFVPSRLIPLRMHVYFIGCHTLPFLFLQGLIDYSRCCLRFSYPEDQIPSCLCSGQIPSK